MTLKRHRRKVALALAALVILGVALFATAGSPGRKALFLARHMECFKRPHNGSGVAAIGDSITAGTSDANWGFLGSDSWFDQAVCNGSVRYSYNAGVPFQTTEMVAARLPALIARRPNVVAILTGTNDVLKRRPLDRAVQLIVAMTDQLRSAGIRPVLGTLPPFEANPPAVDRFNSLLASAAHARSIPLIDFHAVLADGDHYRAGLTADHLHPNVAGATAMARVADPVLRALAP